MPHASLGLGDLIERYVDFAFRNETLSIDAEFIEGFLDAEAVIELEATMDL